MNVKSSKTIFIIFVVALLLRLGYVLFFPQIPVTHDASDYDNLGMQIAAGNGFSQLAGNPAVHRPPLYPFILSIFYYLFGHNYFVVRIFQSFISASFCLLVYGIAKDLMSNRIAILASVLVAIYPAFISYSGLIVTEATAGFLVLASVYFLIVALRKNMLRFYILSGIFLGLLILCRQEMLLLIIILPPALMFIYRNKQKICLLSLTVTLTAILVIIPWTIRNYNQSKAFIPVATGAGVVLWQRTHPSGFIDWNEGVKYEPLKSIIKHRDPEKIEWHIYLNKILLKEGLKNIKLHPFIYTKSCLMHWSRFWIGSHSNSFLFGRDSFVNVISKKEFGVLSLKALLLIVNLLLLFLAGFGMVMSRARAKSLFLILLPIFYVMGIHTILFGTPRFQVPIMPFVLIFSAVGIEAVMKRCCWLLSRFKPYFFTGNTTSKELKERCWINNVNNEIESRIKAVTWAFFSTNDLINQEATKPFQPLTNTLFLFQ